MSVKRSAPLRENRQVRELLSVMKANNMDTGDLIAVLSHVGAMERQLDTAVTELQAMRRELNDMREARDHPVRKNLQNAVHAMEGRVTEAGGRLDALKDSIVDGCKKALAAFKEKGAAALNNLAGFFRIKDGLQSIRDSLSEGIQTAEKSIARIEAVSREYHEIGKHVKNMGRAMAGKEAVPDARPVGKLAKALEAPFKSELACLTGARRSVDGAIGALARLEQAAQRPSVLKTIREGKRQAQGPEAKAPAPEKSKRPEPSL